MTDISTFNNLMNEKKYAEALAWLDNHDLFPVMETNQYRGIILVNIGNTHIHEKKFEKAFSSYSKAIEVAPHNIDAFIGLCQAYKLQGQINQCEKAVRDGLELNPNNIQLTNELGIILMLRGEYDKAKEHFYKCIEIDPNFHLALFNLSKYYLLHDDYLKGFDLSDFRFKCNQYNIENSQLIDKIWRGENLENKTVCVLAEQGFGDTILFSRFLPELKKQCKSLIFYCPEVLHNLCQSMATEIIDIKQNFKDCDFFLPLLSIPKILSLSHDEIPNKVYLSSNTEKVSRWKNKIKNPNKTNIGLALQGNAKMDLNHLRICPIQAFTPLFDMQEYDFYSLSPELNQDELKDHNNFFHFANEFTDFSETAAFIENLDLVISVDSAVAHLAGAMGKPVWIMAYFPPTWHWGISADTTVWYPSARIFRQKEILNWQPVIDQLLQAIKQNF